MKNYRQIFRMAFDITITKPSLWIFGLFAILLGSAGGLELILGHYGFAGGGFLMSFLAGLIEGGLFSVNGVVGSFKLLFSDPIFLFVAVIVILIFVGIGLFVVWITTISQIAIFAITASKLKNKNLTFRQSFDLGIIKFWQVLGLNVITQVVSWIALISLGYIAGLNFFIYTPVFVICFSICLVLSLAVSFLVKYAVAGVVLRGWAFKDSIVSAWDLLKKNWLASTEIALMLFAIYLFIVFILGRILSFLFVQSFQTFISTPLLVSIIFIVLAIVFILVRTFLATFHWVVWALVFEIINDKANNKFTSFLSKLTK